MRAVGERLTIDHVGQRGDGVAYADGATVFVPYTLGGEIVEAAPSPGHAERRKLAFVETASPQRVEPFCVYFGRCGGCAIQHWQPDPYQAWKRQIVIDTLAHARIECPVDPIIDAHGAGRRRITAHARRGGDNEIRVGFAAAASHAIIAIDECPILEPGLKGALDVARALALLLKPTDKPLDIQVTAASNGLDVDVRGTGPLPTPLIAKLSQLAEHYKLARLTRHGELVLMRTSPMITIGTAQVMLPPGSFLQATAAGEDVLAELVVKACKGSKVIVDLFCGVGPFALRLAAKSRVMAYDSDEGAILSLQQAAKDTSGLKPITAAVRDLFHRPLVAQELRDVDAVVFDPPRQGAQAQAEKLAASKVKTVVAVSCNVQSFVRDAKILIDGGYKIDSVTPVDQFRHTPHVELVARFRR
ncbi:MAG: rRNA (uracil-5-)-methyltransferase RumA [Tardiphaga sp.]|nr:rRNA (uracil-5-)-methyltransferase RumA [Tardiphaga sp.]